MKNYKWICAGIMAATLLLTGCGAEDSSSVGVVEGADHIESEELPEQEELTEEDASVTEGADAEVSDAEEGPRVLTIYYSNEMADGLEKTKIEADIVSPELLLSELANYNIVTRDTKALSVETAEEGENTVLLVDMSREFADYVSTMGTSGEYVIIAAFTNTFLDAYHADCLRLTVEGDYLESGHAVYDWDLTKYQTTSYTVDTKVYEKDNIRLEYPQLYNVKDSNTENEWNEVLEAYARKDLEYLDERSSYELTYEVGTATEEFLSIVYRVESYEYGAAHPYSYIQTFNIDLTTGKEWRLKDFIDTQIIVDCLMMGTGFELINTEITLEDFGEYLATSSDVLNAEYFDSFDLDSTNADAYVQGYSYKLDGQLVVCMEVPHALGDFVELSIE